MLDRVVLRFIGISLELNVYYNILRTLGVGGYRDQQLAESQAVGYGNLHFTCFYLPMTGDVTWWSPHKP